MKLKESETIELKRSTAELKEAIISIAAILNKHYKGELYFGIQDDGTAVGQQIGKSTLKDISKSIADHIDPKVYPDIEIRKIAGKDCIHIEFRGHEGLYSAYGRFYLRAGDENKKLSTKEIERLIEKKKNYVYSWGSELSETPISSVKVSTLRSFIKRGKEAGRIGFSFDSPKNVLNKLHLVTRRKLLNAGWVLFSKTGGIEVQVAIFAGRDKITFLDIQSFHGNLFELIEKSEIYVKEHINWRADLSGSQRIEIPEIPVRAIKEAIINSLCHRDFTNPKSNEIAIYRDRIEIYNPGQFPHDYSPDDFIKGTEASIPRNPLIAETLYRSKDIEKWGSGLRRISEECKEAGVKVDFQKIKSGFTVIFYRPEFLEQKAKGVPGNKKSKPVEGLVEGSEKSSEKSSEKIIGEIKKNPSVSAQELSKTLGITSRAVEKHLSRLKEKGIIKRIGPDKGGHWEIIQK